MVSAYAQVTCMSHSMSVHTPAETLLLEDCLCVCKFAVLYHSTRTNRPGIPDLGFTVSLAVKVLDVGSGVYVFRD